MAVAKTRTIPFMSKQTISVAMHATTNTKIAAALVTVGVPFQNSADPASNIYSEEKPYRPGMPGQVTYHMAIKEPRSGIPTQKLVDAYNALEADKQLDAIIDEVHKRIPELGRKLKDILPLALMCYLRGGAENRDRLKDLWRELTPMVLVRREDGCTVLVSRNAPPHILEKFGLQ